MIGVHWRVFWLSEQKEVRKPSMHLTVLCLRRRREDQKLILLHAGGCLHESLWYGGSSVDIWHCWIMALLPCWSRPGQPHAIHAPVTYQKHVEGRYPERCYPIYYTSDPTFWGLSSVISSVSKVILRYSRHLHLNCVKIMRLFCQIGLRYTGLDLVAALISTKTDVTLQLGWRWCCILLLRIQENGGKSVCTVEAGSCLGCRWMAFCHREIS